MRRIEIRDLGAQRNHRHGGGSTQIASIQILIHFAKAHVDALASGPIGGYDHAVPQVVLDAKGGLIAARKREVGRINLHALFGVVDVGNGNAPLLGGLSGDSLAATAGSSCATKLTN